MIPHLLRLLLEDRKVFHHDAPDELQIDPEVLMYQHITKAPHLLSGNFRFQSLMFCSDSARGFRKNLKIPDHRVLHQRASPEGFAPTTLPFRAAFVYRSAT